MTISFDNFDDSLFITFSILELSIYMYHIFRNFIIGVIFENAKNTFSSFNQGIESKYTK